MVGRWSQVLGMLGLWLATWLGLGVSEYVGSPVVIVVWRTYLQNVWPAFLLLRLGWDVLVLCFCRTCWPVYNGAVQPFEHSRPSHADHPLSFPGPCEDARSWALTPVTHSPPGTAVLAVSCPSGWLAPFAAVPRPSHGLPPCNTACGITLP